MRNTKSLYQRAVHPKTARFLYTAEHLMLNHVDTLQSHYAKTVALALRLIVTFNAPEFFRGNRLSGAQPYPQNPANTLLTARNLEPQLSPDFFLSPN